MLVTASELWATAPYSDSEQCLNTALYSVHCTMMLVKYWKGNEKCFQKKICLRFGKFEVLFCLVWIRSRFQIPENYFNGLDDISYRVRWQIKNRIVEWFYILLLGTGILPISLCSPQAWMLTANSLFPDNFSIQFESYTWERKGMTTTTIQCVIMNVLNQCCGSDPDP